jgi:hypothetical protein
VSVVSWGTQSQNGGFQATGGSGFSGVVCVSMRNAIYLALFRKWVMAKRFIALAPLMQSNTVHPYNGPCENVPRGGGGEPSCVCVLEASAMQSINPLT